MANPRHNDTDSTTGFDGTIRDAAWKTQLYDDMDARSPDMYGCSVYNNSTQSIADSTATALTFNTEDYDNGSLHSTVSNTSRATIPTGGDGYYDIKGYATFAVNATGTRRLDIKKNGTTIQESVFEPTPSGSIVTRLHVAAHLQLVATDYVELIVTQSSGGALNAGVAATRELSNRLMVARIG